jgi:cobalt/nickel transport system permease protein
MSHLHFPDGVLPWWLWLPGLALAAVVLYAVAHRHRDDRRDRLALLGALSALMLAAMALPLGPFGYHASLAPVVGIVLGGGLAFLAACITNVALSLLGHGGFTVVGWNALITGTAAAVSASLYPVLARRQPPFWAAAWASGAGMTAALVPWLVVVGVASTTPNPSAERAGVEARAGGGLLVEEHAHAEGALPGVVDAGEGSRLELAARRLSRFALLSLPFWVIGTVAEALLAGGVVAFLARVDPSLLGPAAARAGSAP